MVNYSNNGNSLKEGNMSQTNSLIDHWVNKTLKLRFTVCFRLPFPTNL